MNLEKSILDLMEGLSSINFDIVLKLSVFLLVVFWLVVVTWVWFDSSERTESIVSRILSVIVVLFGNILGLIVYLILRPRLTVQEQYWSELERRYLIYETAELDDCERCGNMMQPGFVFCPICRFEVKVKCEGCGINIDRRWKSCAFCGASNGVHKVAEVVKGAEVVEERDSGVLEKVVQVKRRVKYETFSEFVTRKIAEYKSKKAVREEIIEKKKEEESRKSEPTKKKGKKKRNKRKKR